MMTTKQAAAGAVGLVLALVATGCGDATESIAERAVEEAIEREGGGNVDLDVDGGSFSFTSPDGEVSARMDEDGNMVMTGPDGEVYEADAEGNVTMSGEDGDVTYSTGDNAEVPDDWPEALALPRGAELLSSQTSTVDGERTAAISANVSTAVADLHETYKDALEDAGYEIGGDSLTESSSGDSASLTATKGAQEVTVTAYGAGDGEQVVLTIVVTG